ncbi:14501_t:CDS:2, partial [Acaulospora colombiana]
AITVSPLMVYGSLWCMDLQAVIYDSLNQGRAITVSLPGYSYGTVVDHYQRPDIKNFWVDIEKQQLEKINALQTYECRTKVKQKTQVMMKDLADETVLESREAEADVFNSERDKLDISDHEGAIDDQEVKDATKDKVEEARNNKTEPLKLSEENRKEVEEAYKLIDRRHMWKLSSGKVIEDELYKLGRELEFEHAVHSFILDIDDELVADCFTETELREIELTPIPEVLELSDEVNENLSESDLMEVPDVAEKFESILTILASALNIKSVVQETIKIVQKSGQDNNHLRVPGFGNDLEMKVGTIYLRACQPPKK